MADSTDREPGAPPTVHPVESAAETTSDEMTSLSLHGAGDGTEHDGGETAASSADEAGVAHVDAEAGGAGEAAAPLERPAAHDGDAGADGAGDGAEPATGEVDHVQAPDAAPDEDAEALTARMADAAPVADDLASTEPVAADAPDADPDVAAAALGVDPATPGGDAPDDQHEVPPSGDGAEPVAALEGDDDFTQPTAEVKAIVEALIFASPDPLTPKALFKLLDSEPKEDVLAALEEVKRDYERQGGLQLVEVAGGFQIVTRSDLHEWVRRLFHERSTQKLSVQALETLAVIAYRQPITAIEITEIRGVNTSGVLNTLLERHLVKIVGRKAVVGRPFMYATTKEFLIRFGLKDLSDLPKVEDMAESLGIESRLLVEQTPPEEQLPLSEPEVDTLLHDSGEAAADLPGAGDDPEPDAH